MPFPVSKNVVVVTFLANDDFHQMGCDVILKRENGGKLKLELIYRSKTARDRPSVDEILKIFEKGKLG